jgi:NAD(P)-dependent dehydrogenase (short-subunit alcohol dehydrogenase family)
MSASSIPFDPKGKTIVVTGGASGIGKALCELYAQEGAMNVVVSDINLAGAEELAQAISKNTSTKSVAVKTNVGQEKDMRELIDFVEVKIAPIDLFVANAGVLGDPSEIAGMDIDEEVWMNKIKINFMQSAFMAKFLIPYYLERNGGHILITASAAGLLTQIGSPTYAVTKRAAVAMAEWLSITYGSRGVGVSCMCPQAVDTEMTRSMGGPGVAGVNGMISAEQCALDTLKT